MALNERQRQFAREYLKDLNATQAAIRAGYSKKTAGQSGERLLKHVEIAPIIQKNMDKRVERTEITSDRVLKELFRLATVDIAEAFNEDGTLKPIHEIPEDVRRAISGVDVDTLSGELVRHKIRFWSKDSALEKLGKHLKLFTEKIEHSGKDGQPIQINVVTAVPDGMGDEDADD